jgi:hypothetical protein
VRMEVAENCVKWETLVLAVLKFQVLLPEVKVKGEVPVLN